MEELFQESIELGFEGRLKLYLVERALPFYRDIGFTESEDASGELKLTTEAAEAFLERKREFRQTGRKLQ